MSKTNEFPKQMFVTIDNEFAEDADGNPVPFFIADDEINEFEDGRRVAIYELKSVHVKRVQHDLVDRPKAI